MAVPSTGQTLINVLQSEQGAAALREQKDALNSLTATTLTTFKAIVVSWGISFVMSNIVDIVLLAPKVLDVVPQIIDVYNRIANGSQPQYFAPTARTVKKRKVVIYQR
jgi:hypothetical protein